jgi:hypothetical protein
VDERDGVNQFFSLLSLRKEKLTTLRVQTIKQKLMIPRGLVFLRLSSSRTWGLEKSLSYLSKKFSLPLGILSRKRTELMKSFKRFYHSLRTFTVKKLKFQCKRESKKNRMGRFH